MGMSIRTGHTMNFRFPPCLWQDLTRVDQPPSSGGEKQIQAIRDGLGSIVPLGVMQVFTWLQFQQTVFSDETGLPSPFSLWPLGLWTCAH